MSLNDTLPDSEAGNSTRVVQRQVTYSVKNDPPNNPPDVLLLFHGLFWFTFHGKDECEIGIHNTTQGHLIPHLHPHELDITIWEITGSGTDQRKCTKQAPPIHIGNPKTIEGIHIDVIKPTSASTGVYVYEKKGPFSRPDSNNDPRDWRWVLDFEQAPFYPGGIKLKPETVNPVISINHGLFYTLHKTTSTFDLLPGSGAPIPIGNVAQYIGANIFLEHDGEVRLTVRHSFPHPPTGRTLEWKSGTRYQIDITNDCFKAQSHCKFEDPAHATNKKKRNDFYLYYDCFDVPRGSHEIGLKKSGSGGTATLPDYVCIDEREKKYIESNNDSPCGSVVAGQGGNS